METLTLKALSGFPMLSRIAEVPPRVHLLWGLSEILFSLKVPSLKWNIVTVSTHSRRGFIKVITVLLMKALSTF